MQSRFSVAESESAIIIEAMDRLLENAFDGALAKTVA